MVLTDNISRRILHYFAILVYLFYSTPTLNMNKDHEASFPYLHLNVQCKVSQGTVVIYDCKCYFSCNFLNAFKRHLFHSMLPQKVIINSFKCIWFIGLYAVLGYR